MSTIYISMATKKEEYIKCATDKTRKYFIETYLSTFNADERTEVAFKLFPRQLVFLDSLVENPNTIAIKHRQAGITTVSAAWITGQIVFANRKSPETILCIGNKLDISQQLLEKIAGFLDQVPRWMWGADYYSPDPTDPKNRRSIYITRNKAKLELFNGCTVHARSSGENAARGISAVSILIFDEAAFIQNGMTVYAQAVAATSSVRDAKIIMVSTPNGKDHLYYRTYNNALKGENNYHPVEFKWFQDPRYNRNLYWSKKNPETGEIELEYDPVIDKRGNIEYNEGRWRKLEKDGWIPNSPWYTSMCKSFNNDEMRIAQELNVSFLGSSDNVIPPEVIEAHLNQNVIELPDDWPLKDPLMNETWIWEDPIPGHRYICACDISSGSSDDRTAIEMIDVDAIDENGKPYFNQVLEYYGKRTADEVGEMIYHYGTMYNDALVVVECIGGYGDGAVLQLKNMKYPNLYYDEPSLKTYTAQTTYARFNMNETEKLPGFRTNSLRIQCISTFVAMLKDNSFRVRSSRIISEMETWIWKSGRPDHMDGCHDDTLTCLSMGLFILQYYMIRSDKQKAKDKVMVSSWRTGGGITTTKHEQDNISMHDMSKKNPPFYSSSYFNKQKDSNIMAMLMLGGYYKEFKQKYNGRKN